MKRTPEVQDAFVRHLNDGGCPVLRDHGYKIAPAGLSIEKIPGTSFNRMFTLAHGGTGYEIEFVIRNEAPRPIDVVGFQIRTRWGIPTVSLLPAPMKSSERYPHYCFPDPGPYYDGGYVLNRFFARRKSRLHPGAKLEGVLVASSEEAIPADVPHLARMIATLVIFDSRRNEYSAQFRLPVIRREIAACELEERAREAREREQLEPVRKLKPRAYIALPAHKVSSDEERAEALLRFEADMAAASERHRARMALARKPASDVDSTVKAGIKAGVGRDG